MRRFSRLLHHSVTGLGRNRLRTFLMLLGPFVGVAALVTLLAIGRDTRHDMLERFQRMLGGSTVFLRAGGMRMVGGAHGSSGPTTTLTLDDLAAIRRALPDVTHLDPMIMGGAREVIYDGRSERLSVIGHGEASEIVWNRSVTRGAYFTADHVASAARVALVGENVARGLFQGRNPVGEQIRIGAVPFRVAGVLEPVGIDPHGIDKDNEIIIPVTTMMRRVLNIDYVLGAKIGFTPGTDLDDAVLRIQDALRPRHAIGPDDQDDFHTFTPVQVEEAVAGANRVFTLFLPLVAGISILVGGLVVANLMLVTVSERRGEIGLRKALGARERDVQFQFLVESAAVTGLGGALAVAGASLALLALSHIQDVPPVVPWDAALLGIGSATLVGLVAGVAPARRAAALDPARTLR